MSPPEPPHNGLPVAVLANDTEDYYGSDWGDDGEALLVGLLEDAELLRDEPPLAIADIEEHALHHFAIVPLTADITRRTLSASTQVQGDPPVSVVHDDSQIKHRPEEPQLNAHGKPDTRSPLERFRTPPKKPLSVTDLVSPAWCELQYWYNLTKFGKKLQTPAMARGSSVHKVLEEQVHQVVPVDVQTREDHWGLRIWNIVQGLRTLRVTGMTRELEVWGTIDGLVVNGVIDELSYTCTDYELEAALSRDDSKTSQAADVPHDQKTISEYFSSQSSDTPHFTFSQHFGQQSSHTAQQDHQVPSKIYLTDVKTRNHNSLPKGVSLRPTHMQLMLYHTLLSRLACNQVDAQKVFERYRVHPTAPFSDALIAQLGSLDFNFKEDADIDSVVPVESQSDAISELLAHNNLTALWTLMIREFQTTFPRGQDSISRVLRAEYRSSHDGHIIGSKTFVHSDQEIEGYVIDELDWWRGKRKAKGVDIEEAFKCRICEHAEGCEWRLTKVEEAAQHARLRQSSLREPS